MSSRAPSRAPIAGSPDYYRNALMTLASPNRLVVQCTDEPDESQRIWWATYRLVNPDGSDGDYLGSSSGTTTSVAREHAAQQSLETLRALINSRSESIIVDDTDGYVNTSV
jgi:hypothetical protein